MTLPHREGDYNMKKLMLIKDFNVKTLVSGDKSCRITLESIYPRDIDDLSKLANELEITVTFDIDDKKD